MRRYLVADKPAVRRVILKFWEYAVERTEAEIEELKVHGYFVRDAEPGDELAPHAEAENQRAAAAAVLAASSAAPPPVTATSPVQSATPPAAEPKK
jgi:hypothetical protein